MDKNVKDFLNEMDELTKKGVFGDDAEMLSYLKDKVDTQDFFSTVVLTWIKDKNQIGKDKVYKIIKLLLKLYCDCLQANQEKAMEILNYFVDGVKTIPNSDIVTPFYIWFQSLDTWRKSIALSGNANTDYQIIQNAFTTYQKGVELANKILLVFICLKHEMNGDNYDPEEIYHFTLYEKSQRYKKIFDGDYLEILDLIDRDLRNAESHLNLRYSRRQKRVIYLVKRKKSLKRKEMDVAHFLVNYFPNPGHIIQGYIFSLILFILIGETFISEFKKLGLINEEIK